MGLEAREGLVRALRESIRLRGAPSLEILLGLSVDLVVLSVGGGMVTEIWVSTVGGRLMAIVWDQS